MKHREDGFLSSQQIDHNGDQFDYIKELHTYLWRIVRVVRPGASGNLDDHIDHAIEAIESADLLELAVDAGNAQASPAFFDGRIASVTRHA